MPFGHMPHRTAWKHAALRLFGWPNLVRRLQAPVLMRFLSLDQEAAVLDAGCGIGTFTHEVARRCRMSVGIDWSLDGWSSVAGKGQPDLACVRGDVQRLPFSSERFDRVLLSSVLQMVEDDVTLLRECYRVLRKGGILVLSVPVGYVCLRGLNRLRPQLKERFGSLGKAYYGREEVLQLLREAGFGVEETEYSPKRWGSFVLEVGLFLWHHIGFPLFSPFLFPLLYPIAYPDHLASAEQKGNELVVKARKVSA